MVTETPSNIKGGGGLTANDHMAECSVTRLMIKGYKAQTQINRIS